MGRTKRSGRVKLSGCANVDISTATIQNRKGYVTLNEFCP
jgi:hypothetical protein